MLLGTLTCRTLPDVRHIYYFTKTLFPSISICIDLVCSIKSRTSSKLSCRGISTEKRSSRTDEFSKKYIHIIPTSQLIQNIFQTFILKKEVSLFPCNTRSNIDLSYNNPFTILSFHSLFSRP